MDPKFLESRFLIYGPAHPLFGSLCLLVPPKLMQVEAGPSVTLLQKCGTPFL